jgi:hypothetical protein
MVSGKEEFVIGIIGAEVMRIVKIHFLVDGGTLAAGRQGFGGECETDLVDGRGRGTETAKFAFNVRDVKNRRVLDGGDECTQKFLAGGTRGTTKSFGARFWSKVRNVDTLCRSVGRKVETESGVCASDAKSNIGFLSERTGSEIKREDMDRGFFSGNGIAILYALQVLNIWWDIGVWEIVHAFVKTGVVGNFYALSFDIKPQDVLEGVGEEAEEDAFACMIAQFAVAEARRSDPDATTKRSECTEVGFCIVASFEGRRGVGFAGESIFDAQVVMEGIGPKTGIKGSTGEHGTEGVSDRLVGSFYRTILVRTVGAGGSNGIAKFLEQRSDLGVLVEFPSLVQVDILVGDAGGVSK